MNPNHQFSPTMQSYYIPPANAAPGPQTHSRRGVPYPPPYANSPAGGAAQQLAGTPVRDPLGNLYFLPKYPPDVPPQLCQLCRSIFGGAGAPHPEYHPHYHPHYHPPPQVSPQCLKITQNVAFKIASEASYVYVLSGQKFIKNAKNGLWRLFKT